jgi:Phage protein Gp138 N-terminal domain
LEIHVATSPQPSALTQLTPSQVLRADVSQWLELAKQQSVDIRVATPAFLTQDMDAATQTVTVQVAIQERVRTAIGPQWWDIPPIIMVPVVMPRGGGYGVTLPLKKGDEGLLVFCDTCFDLWWQRGQTGAPTAANVAATARAAGVTAAPSGSQRQNEVRRHYLHDCGFIPGMSSQPNVLLNYSTNSLQIRSDDGMTVIDVAESGVTITGAAVTAANGGTIQKLMTDAFYQYWVTIVLPFLESKGFTGGTPPLNSETTVLKGQ